MYFALLEVVPLSVVLYYFRKIPAPMDYSIFEDAQPHERGLLVADDFAEGGGGLIKGEG
jgi:hypothetical protein